MMAATLEVERLLRVILPGTRWEGRVFSVGGSVRDELLGNPSKDLDLVVEEADGAEAFTKWLYERYPNMLSHPHCLGAGYPIWQLVFKAPIEDKKHGSFATESAIVEVADTQAEAFPDPQSRQRITRFGSLVEDCERRDFTVNMLYRDLSRGELLDPSGCGLEDLKKGVLRGHPRVDLRKIFGDDPLRMIRLFRFRCRFGWSIPESVLSSVRECAPRITILSSERIREELIKMTVTGRFYEGLELMRTNGVLEQILPELLPMVGCGQDPLYHSEGDVWVHTLEVIEHAPPRPVLQLAALLHDIGKPPTRTVEGSRIKFLGHEKVSAAMTGEILKRLKFDSTVIRKAVHLIELHLRGGDVELWTSLKPARKLIRDAGEDLDDLLALIEADSASSHGPDGCSRMDHLPKLRAKLAEAQVIPILERPVLNGSEVMKLLGLKPGREVGEALAFLQRLEDDEAEQGRALEPARARERLLEWWPRRNSSM